MVDISALMKALPTSGLRPDWVASLGSFIDVPKEDRGWRERIWLLEPPAGQRIPYIEPVEALEKLLRHQGIALEDAKARSFEAVARIKKDVAENHWVSFFDDHEPDSPECLPVPEFVAWLRREGTLIPPDIVNFLEQASDAVAYAPIFRGPDNWDEEAWSLETLPGLPPPKAMIEFVPGPFWVDLDDGNWYDDPGSYYHLYKPFQIWRESMLPTAQALEKALGEPVYYFADLSCDYDDDLMHRFLVLHWCCTWKPESTYVRYLLKVSKARDVEELKAALIDPTNYTHPFEMYDPTFVALEALSCRINYLPPETRKTVGVVFLTAQAREVVQWLLAQQISVRVLIVAPKELATSEWVKQATRHCRDWTVRFVYDGKLDEPIDILASIDELCVIANEPTQKSDSDLDLSDSVEDLLWLAFDLDVEAKLYFPNTRHSSNAYSSLRDRGVPKRVAARQAKRAAFTRQLEEIRLNNDFGSSGLWDAEGKMLGYDQLDLPFPLIRRIAAWQRDYDNTMNPPNMGDEAWWRNHEQEALDLAKVLQTALSENTVVKLYRKQGWMSVDEVVRAEGGEP